MAGSDRRSSSSSLFALFVAARTIRIIPQARAGVVERLGRYSRTLEPGLTIVMPFIDRVKPLIDLREQVVNFPPQPVITEDNVVVQHRHGPLLHDHRPEAATYEIANPLQAIEQLTVTTLRNVIGGLTLEDALTSRDNVNTQLRIVLDEATGKWGIRINRVEIKSVDPPPDIQEAMEKQMRAERDRRAAILTAEGVKQSQILTAEGEKQAAMLTAEGERQAAILRAEGEAKAIDTVFDAIHAGDPDRELLSYQYLQMLPKLAEGDANKIFVIPSEFDAGARRHRRRRSAGRRLADELGAQRRAAGAPSRRADATPCSTPSPRSSRRRSPTSAARGTLTEDDVDAAMREIRLALLEADVNFKVVKQFTAAVKERCARRRGDRPAQPRPAGREDRQRRAERADGRRRSASSRSRRARRR